MRNVKTSDQTINTNGNVCLAFPCAKHEQSFRNKIDYRKFSIYINFLLYKNSKI